MSANETMAEAMDEFLAVAAERRERFQAVKRSLVEALLSAHDSMDPVTDAEPVDDPGKWAATGRMDGPLLLTEWPGDDDHRPWLDRITFTDRGVVKGGGRNPCHVPGKILFNGHLAPIRVAKDDGLEVCTSGGIGDSEVNVTMTVHPRDVTYAVKATWMRGDDYDEAGTPRIIPYAIGGHRILSPLEPLWEIEPWKSQEFYPGAHFPVKAEPTNLWIRVTFMVPEIEFVTVEEWPNEVIKIDPETDTCYVEEKTDA